MTISTTTVATPAPSAPDLGEAREAHDSAARDAARAELARAAETGHATGKAAARGFLRSTVNGAKRSARKAGRCPHEAALVALGAL